MILCRPQEATPLELNEQLLPFALVISVYPKKLAVPPRMNYTQKNEVMV